MRVGKFGDKLRRERELRAVTLDEIAEATKIGTRSLKALEEEQFDILPGGIFNKGFVRAYAKYLGIDEEQAVADYMAANGETATKTATLSDDELVASVLKKRAEPERAVSTELPSSKAWVALALIALLAAGGYSAWRYYQQRYLAQTEPISAPSIQAQVPQQVTALPAEITEAPNSQSATPVPATPSEIQTQPTTNSGANSTVAGEFTVKLHARELAWVSVQADGKTVLERLLDADTDQTITAKESVILKVGKPGAVEVSFNGKPVGALGPPDKTATRTFTIEGMQQ